MIDLVGPEDGNVVTLRLNGKLLHDDYTRLVPKLEEILEKHGGIRCLIEMEDFGGFELRALWDETKFDAKHAKQIERCAVVGNKDWERWMTKLSGLLFTQAELRYFDAADREAAGEWIRK